MKKPKIVEDGFPKDAVVNLQIAFEGRICDALSGSLSHAPDLVGSPNTLAAKVWTLLPSKERSSTLQYVAHCSSRILDMAL